MSRKDKMENLNSVFSRPMPTPASLLEMAPITQRQQMHLGKVYSHLAMGVVMTTLGAYVDAKVFGIPPIVSGIVAMLCAMSILSEKSNKIDQGRLGKFFAFAFFKGMSIGHFMFEISNLFLFYFVVCWNSKRQICCTIEPYRSKNVENQKTNKL